MQAIPAWVTVNVWPWTVTVPVRGEVAVLAATFRVTVVLLVLVMVVHACAAVAVHEQVLLLAATPKLTVPPEEPTLAEAGERL